MNLNDAVNLKGELKIISIDLDGNTSLLVNDKNLIVLNGRTIIANSLVGSGSAYITDVHFGTGGASPTNPANPLPVNPNETDVISLITGLINPSDYTFSSSVVTSPTPRIEFTITIPTTSANLNGKGMNEAALMLNTNPVSAFSIKRFSTITKSSSISLVLNWIIYV